MKKVILIYILIALLNMIPAIAFANKITPLEQRQNETHICNTSDKTRVMVAVANTLQDSDFIVEDFEPEIGFIRAKKIFKKMYINKGRLAGQSALLALTTSYAVFTWGSTAAYTYTPARKITDELHEKNVVVDANVLVENFGKDKTKVRLVLAQKVLQNAEGFSYTKNAPLRAFRIYDKPAFDEFFAQLDSKL